MNSILRISPIFSLIIITIILNMVPVYADETSDLQFCAKGEDKDGITVKICSVDKEKCDNNVKASEISASCHKIH
ncbi:MAG TPA: hypothetical protein VH481_04230 [Nitrososphaeraceae archaeon]